MKAGAPFWSSKFAFFISSVGAVVGLGNIWKFPYMAGTQGGGAFVFIYLATIFLIAIPVLLSELIIGRIGRGDPVSSVQNITKTSPPTQRRLFAPLGWLAIFLCILVFSFYSVVVLIKTLKRKQYIFYV